MDLSNEFWNAYKSDVLIGDAGAIRFTRTGRRRYAPLFAKYGFALDHVRTVERFFEVMGQVNAAELEENTLDLERAFQDPLMSAVERDLIRRVLAHGIQSTE
jgi:hypothetical protein